MKQITANAKLLLEKRYLRKNNRGEVIETPDDMFHRVASVVAEADRIYKEDSYKSKDEFYKIMSNLDFLPNSPCLMNAGTRLGQLSACFSLTVPDSIGGIFETVKESAIIMKTGGGVGIVFSHIRPKNSIVSSTKGYASGVVSFMEVFNTTAQTIKQGGKRRGACMAVLHVSHPEIFDFIDAKKKDGILSNFNISVAIDDKFMKAYLNDAKYQLINPHTKTAAKEVKAKDIMKRIVNNAWRNGEPGVIFIDTINKKNPLKKLGEIEGVNPCAEQPLLRYESCNLGSINLSHMLKHGQIDWNKLERTVNIAVHFLDNVIDINKFPIARIEEMTKKTRKIGLGVMGFADMIAQLKAPYDSLEAMYIADTVMRFINQKAKEASRKLAGRRGVFPAFKYSTYKTEMRNATVTTIAPTGSISIIANCSSGIEPYFALSMTKNVMDNDKLYEINAHFINAMKREGLYSEELMNRVIETGSASKFINGIWKEVFKTAHEIDYRWHIKMLATFQKHTDNGVSKTINLPHDADKDTVRDAILMAYKAGCKGITVYRDGSRKNQVLNKKKLCPVCGKEMIKESRCYKCNNCSFSECSL